LERNNEEEQEQLDAAVSALLDGIEPEEREFIGGLIRSGTVATTS